MIPEMQRRDFRMGSWCLTTFSAPPELGHPASSCLLLASAIVEFWGPHPRSWLSLEVRLQRECWREPQLPYDTRNHLWGPGVLQAEVYCSVPWSWQWKEFAAKQTIPFGPYVGLKWTLPWNISNKTKMFEDRLPFEKITHLFAFSKACHIKVSTA